MVNGPEAEPAAVGERFTERVHVAAGKTKALHVLVCANGKGAVTPVNCSGPVPVFVPVIVLAGLVVPCTDESDPGERVAGQSLVGAESTARRDRAHVPQAAAKVRDRCRRCPGAPGSGSGSKRFAVREEMSDC